LLAALVIPLVLLVALLVSHHHSPLARTPVRGRTIGFASRGLGPNGTCEGVGIFPQRRFLQARRFGPYSPITPPLAQSLTPD
jgi:hypothetical protein